MCMQKLSKMFGSRSRAATWDIVARCNTSAAVDLPPPESKTFSFLCQDQRVKVGSNIYHLDRFKASLKSDYFEKLFTSGEFGQRNDKILEIQPKNSDFFPTIVDLLHEKKLSDVLNKDNCVPLLEAMDYFEMTPDLKIVCEFIENDLKLHSIQDAKVFELYSFIRKNTKFEYLLPKVFKFMSDHLATVRNHEIFPSISLGHLIQIIKNVEDPDDEKKYEIVQMCTEWLCHDMENRLPHIVMLINSIKPEFHSKEKGESKLCQRLPKTDIDEQAKRKTMMNCVFSLLAYGGKLNPSIIDRETLSMINYDGYDSDYEFLATEESEYEVYEEKKYDEIPFDCYSENRKLKKFLDNGDFYDITVRVGEKSYKLHRSVLESKSGYFSSIFRTEYAEAVAEFDGNAPKTYPNKDKEYLLDNFDQSTFHKAINYIYLIYEIPTNHHVSYDKRFEFEFDTFFHILKTADVLKIENLSKDIKSSLKTHRRAISSQDVIEILNYTHGKVKYNDLYSIYLCKHMTENWPEIYNLAQFCSISWPVLEEILKSPDLRFDDPNKILDICSTWVTHDVKNRYRLLPEIAKVINPFCEPNYQKYAAENASLNDCSQQLIRDELWEILSSIEYLTSSQSISANIAENPEDIPLFITKDRHRNIDLLNADLDIITPSGFSGFSEDPWDLSAAKIGDNLFVLCCLPYSDGIALHVYNFKLKKRFALFSCSRIADTFPNMQVNSTLLTCSNEIYCCWGYGMRIAKFSIQLNRWVLISKEAEPRNGMDPRVWFASDGKKLYRASGIPGYARIARSSSHIIEWFDFEKKLWTRAPDLPTKEVSCASLNHFTVINDGNLAALFFVDLVIFDGYSKKCRYFRIPTELWKEIENAVFIQHQDKLLFVIDNKFYHVDLSNNNWEFKKDLKTNPKYNYSEVIISAIHRAN